MTPSERIEQAVSDFEWKSQKDWKVGVHIDQREFVRQILLAEHDATVREVVEMIQQNYFREDVIIKSILSRLESLKESDRR